ncbi:AfsR/SARP family transcriptional regulator [Kribbella deserti]|uniref:BTAD domain-containing putative transcriptional regulator n=1 Tax=Kribbella deserti TaxID=1926257 RepID=A0ABV6QVG3_9ACTN
MARRWQIRFHVLGPLELCGDDGRQVISAAKPRLLLAVLLCHANTVVPPDRLVDELWGAEAPATARQLLHGYAAALRRMLADPDGATLVTRPGGYQLVAAPGDLDARTFLDLADTGRRQLRESAFEAAAGTFAAALKLWGGSPLADVPSSPSVEAERTRLQAVHLAVVEGRIEAELACGRHEDVVPELEALLREHPLREEPRRQLMLALYRTGRQADALAVFQDLRRRLVEELGIEPGPALQQLQQEILSAAPVLQGTSGPSAKPWQLPPDTASFSGRDEELAWVQKLLEPAGSGGPAATAAICGPGGMGKSALAVHVAHRLADRFPDGILYVDLRGATAGLQPLDPQVVLTRFLRAFGVPAAEIPASMEEATALFRTLLADRRTLQVLDNAADAVQVRPLLPASDGSAVIVTSRQPLTTLDGASTLHLPALPPSQAVELLERLVGVERIAAEPTATEDLIRQCDFLPLAVRIAGARLAARPSWPVNALVERLADERRRLDELQLGDLAVRTSFQVSYWTLANSSDPDDLAAARMFRLLGLLDGPDLSTAIASVLAGRPSSEAERSLERLADAQLVAAKGADRYGLHDLLRLFARELAIRDEPEQDRLAAVDRAVRCLVATTRLACQMISPTDIRAAGPVDGALPLADRDEATDWLEAELPNLAAIARQCAADVGHASVPTQLAVALFRYLDMRGHWNAVLAIGRAALAGATLRGDRTAEGQAVNAIGSAYLRQQRYEEAKTYMENALAIRRELDDIEGVGISLNNLGLLHKHLGDLPEAIRYLEESLEVRRRSNDPRSAARSLDNLGVVLRAAGDPARSVDCHQQGLEIARAEADRQLQGLILGNLSEAYLAAGTAELALAPAQEALAICRELGHEMGEADALRCLGSTYEELGELDQGREQLQAALAIYERFGAFPAAELRERLAAMRPAPARLQPESSHLS